MTFYIERVRIFSNSLIEDVKDGVQDALNDTHKTEKEVKIST